MLVYLKNNATVSYSPLKMRSGPECLFVMVCETLPLPVYPIVFRHPGLPVGGKHSIFNFMHRHVRSFLLVSLIWQPACASSQRRRGWWKKTSPIFWIWIWIWTAIPSSTARYVNPTYSTFKNGEAVVTSQTAWVSARAYMLRLLHSRNKHDNSHYRLYKIINTRLR